MRRTTPIVSAFVMLALLISSTASTPSNIVEHDPCTTESSSFVVGEELVYAIYYNWKFVWIPAGEVSFLVSEDDTDYIVEIVGKTYPSYNNFFEVDDYFSSKINKETGLPSEFVRIVHEGNYHKFDSIYFDQKEQLANSYVGYNRAQADTTEHLLETCMHDMISVLYHVRGLNFDQMKKNDILALDVMFDKETYPVDLKYSGKKKKKIKNIGKRKTLLLEPSVVAGEVFDENTRMKIYASDDVNRLPLLIESPVSVGSVKAVLKSARGLASPIDLDNE